MIDQSASAISGHWPFITATLESKRIRILDDRPNAIQRSSSDGEGAQQRKPLHRLRSWMSRDALERISRQRLATKLVTVLCLQPVSQATSRKELLEVLVRKETPAQSGNRLWV